MTRDVRLQICQVLTVLVLAPLLQRVIVRWEERVQRTQGPGMLQPYRDLWKVFHKQLVVPETASEGRHRGVPIFERLLERARKMPAEFGLTGTDA